MSPGPHIVRPITSLTSRVMLCPAYNALASAWTLNTVGNYSGLAKWIEETAESLSTERAGLNRLVFEGLFDAAVLIEAEPDWPDFPAYLADLESRDPHTLSDGVLHRLLSVAAPAESLSPADLLNDRALYLELVRTAVPDQGNNGDLHAEAHALLNDPPVLQAVIVEHLRWMWEHVLSNEWKRIAPLLRQSVTLYATVDLAGLGPLDAVRTITGRELERIPTQEVGAPRRLTFIPSAHVGPYLVFFAGKGNVFVIFGARQPTGLSGSSGDLTRVELLNLLDALADDTRLRILEWLTASGERSSQAIMTRFALSQSATSRHLRQLSAAGFLAERRQGGASKVYHINPDRIRETMVALGYLLRDG